MSASESTDLERNDGPPAKNLRKNSGRSVISETNMAGVSDKTSKQREGRKIKSNQGKGHGPSGSTPSVKDWVKQNEGKNLQSSDNTWRETETYFTEEEDEWSAVQRREQVYEDWSNNYGYEEERNQWYQQSAYQREYEQQQLSQNEINSEEEEDRTSEEDELSESQAQKKFEREKAEFAELNNEEMMTKLYETIIKMKEENEKERKVRKQQGREQQRKQKVSEKEMTTLKNKMKRCEDKVQTLANVVIKQDETIRNMASKIIRMEQRSMKRNVLISGVTERKGKDCKEIAVKFFEQKVKTSKAIKVGVKLGEVTEKGLIYKATKNLKGQTNEDGDPYFVEDQVPEEISEQKKRRKQIVKYNRTLIEAHQQEIEWKKGQLYVDGEIYEPKIKALTNAEVVKISMDEEAIRRILAIRITQAGEMSKQGNKFLGFTLKVHTLKQVIDA